MKLMCQIILLTLCFSIGLSSSEARLGGRFHAGRSYHSSFGTINSPQRQASFQSYRPYRQSANVATQPLGFFQNNSFMSSMLAGFAGSWIGSMIFNHHNMTTNTNSSNSSSSDGNMGSWIGSNLPWLLLLGVGIFLFRKFRQQNQSTLQTNRIVNNTFSSQEFKTIQITPQDFQNFAQILIELQTAWSHADIEKLQNICTQQIFEHFSQTLSDNESEKVKNQIEDVQLINQELVDSWQDQSYDFASVKMSWFAKDYFIRTDRHSSDPDYIVDGDANHALSTTEIWTFKRPIQQGKWLLAGIQQAIYTRSE